ncbi:hypothetical protein AB8989_18950 [Yersinia hibernica]|uniref:Uncharacterized protein n=1 Tax=Yersinia hibernica TaxID=2339259 RepID=A0ABX5R4P0_9GAMM|nr:hypothetical protein [Yersinia hibernica]QAX80358.1 hypothetical protein D5F51_18555 [Yersinia hibernica]
MKASKLFLFLIAFSPLSVFSEEINVPEFKDNKVEINKGLFSKRITLTQTQQNYSSKWKDIMQKELTEKVNFAGHYRLYISKGGVLTKECGVNGWVCGWIIDKRNGEVISELPLFNENTNYYSTIDNGTPSPDPFFIEFYPDSNLIWINGENIPKSKVGNISYSDKKCSNNAYVFKENHFNKIFSGECKMESDD